MRSPSSRKTDIGQLFATLEQALERRRIAAQNRRLVWELQTINEIASGISRSLELTEILTGALQRLVRAMDGIAGSIRLRDRVTDRFEDRAAVGLGHDPPALDVVPARGAPAERHGDRDRRRRW